MFHIKNARSARNICIVGVGASQCLCPVCSREQWCGVLLRLAEAGLRGEYQQMMTSNIDVMPIATTSSRGRPTTSQPWPGIETASRGFRDNSTKTEILKNISLWI